MKKLGYKVYCKEQHKRQFVRLIITNSYDHAVFISRCVALHPKKLLKAKWKIVSITKKDLRRGLLRGCPFDLT